MAVRRQHAVPYGIHPSVHAVKPAARRTKLHRPGTEAKHLELPERDDTMLPRCQLGQPPLQTGRVELAKLSFAFSTRSLAALVHPTSVGRFV